MSFIIVPKYAILKKGDCYRCGCSKREIKKDKISCYSWGKTYSRHLYKK